MPLRAKTTILSLLIRCAYTLRRQEQEESLKGDQIHTLVFGRKRNLDPFNQSVSSLDLSKKISQLPVLMHVRLSNNTDRWESLITNREPPGLRIHSLLFPGNRRMSLQHCSLDTLFSLFLPLIALLRRGWIEKRH